MKPVPTFLGYPIVCNEFDHCTDHYVCRQYRYSLINPRDPAFVGVFDSALNKLANTRRSRAKKASS